MFDKINLAFLLFHVATEETTETPSEETTAAPQGEGSNNVEELGKDTSVSVKATATTITSTSKKLKRSRKLTLLFFCFV